MIILRVRVEEVVSELPLGVVVLLLLGSDAIFVAMRGRCEHSMGNRGAGQWNKG